MKNRTFDPLFVQAESALHYKYRLLINQEDPATSGMMDLREEIRKSERVKLLLSERTDDGIIHFHPYFKFRGAHWVLAMLAEMCYPQGDSNLEPLKEQVLNWLLSIAHLSSIKTINGKVRRCASQEGLAVFTLVKLGLLDDRLEKLVDHLCSWQWEDGGWNCDKRPQAKNSSYYESWIPLRALNLFQQVHPSTRIALAVEKGAELFLKRRLYKGLKDGLPIREDFVKLAYPNYWMYNIVCGLLLMLEIGTLEDPRCKDALDLLESRQLRTGGFPADFRHYTPTQRSVSRSSLVKWGAVNPEKINEFVTLDALYLLKIAGRSWREG